MESPTEDVDDEIEEVCLELDEVHGVVDSGEKKVPIVERDLEPRST